MFYIDKKPRFHPTVWSTFLDFYLNPHRLCQNNYQTRCDRFARITFINGYSLRALRHALYRFSLVESLSFGREFFEFNFGINTIGPKFKAQPALKLLKFIGPANFTLQGEFAQQNEQLIGELMEIIGQDVTHLILLSQVNDHNATQLLTKLVPRLKGLECELNHLIKNTLPSMSLDYYRPIFKSKFNKHILDTILNKHQIKCLDLSNLKDVHEIDLTPSTIINSSSLNELTISTDILNLSRLNTFMDAFIENASSLKQLHVYVEHKVSSNKLTFTQQLIDSIHTLLIFGQEFKDRPTRINLYYRFAHTISYDFSTRTTWINDLKSYLKFCQINWTHIQESRQANKIIYCFCDKSLYLSVEAELHVFNQMQEYRPEDLIDNSGFIY